MRATYYDGKSAVRHDVDVEFRDGRVIVWNDRIRRDEPLGSAAISEHLDRAPRTLTFADGAVCEVAECPELERAISSRSSGVERAQRQWPAVMVCFAMLILIGAAAYRFGIPLFASRVADRIPDPVAQRLSAAVLKTADGDFLRPSKLPAPRQTALRVRFGGMKRPEETGQPRDSLLFRSAPQWGANAFTLPDGSILLLDELVELADTDDQIIAVLCHEAGHAHYRHGLRRLLQDTLLGAAFFAWVGDANGLVAGTSAIALQTRYSRDFEREADAYGASMLRANGLSPLLLAEVLEKLASDLKKRGIDEEAMGGYLSTHPLTQERIAALKGKS